MNTTQPILHVRDLHVAYGRVEALYGISLKVGAGEIATVIGPNGAGKSTMMNAIAGVLPPYARTQGVVELQGEDIASVPVEERLARGMCLVPETRALFASMPVEDNLLLGSYSRYRARDRNYADQLDMVYELFPRLKERRKQQAGTLSGGERQMVALGRALMAKPRLLMLDEPSLGLAPRIVQEILQIVLQLKKTGVATLLVEQNARAALQVADYAYVLETGNVALEGPARELAGDPRVIETYLGLSAKAA